MSRNEISTRQLRLWTLLAETAALSHYGGGGYMAAALAAGALLPLNLLFGDGFHRMGKAASFLEWGWAVAVLAHLLSGAGAYWPGNGSALAVPLVLLALAAMAGGKEKAARAGSTLFWLAGVMLLGVALAAVSQIQVEWLVPVPGEWTAGLIVSLLLPSLASALLPGCGKAKTVLWTGVIAVAAAAILQGTLCASVAMGEDAPLFELGRGLGNGGYEILVSTAATLGWYALTSLLFEASAVFAEQWGMEKQSGRSLSFGAAAIGLVLGMKLDGRILTGGCLLMWILIPMLHPKNKMKKDEKRC